MSGRLKLPVRFAWFCIFISSMFLGEVTPLLPFLNAVPVTENLLLLEFT